MNINKIEGILGFPVTPFTDENKIDLKGYKNNIEFLIKNGLTDIFVACGAGEFHAIDLDEYEELLRVAAEYKSNNIRLYAGVGGNIAFTKKQLQIAEAYQFDGLLIMPPYLIEPSTTGLLNYLTDIITATKLNTIVYHRDNCKVDLAILEELSQYENLIGFKDGVGNMEDVIAFTHKFGDRFSWINGLPLAEVTMKIYHSLGFKSYSSAISNYIPHISKKYYEALKNGDAKTEYEIYESFILPIHKIRSAEKGYAVALIKAGINIINPNVGLNVRSPINPVKDHHYQELKMIVNAAKSYAEEVKL